MNRLLRLYPASWRDRYGLELEALLADRPPGMRDRIDIVRGALDARLHPQLLTGAPRPRAWPIWVVVVAVLAGLAYMAAAWSLTSQPAFSDSDRDASRALLLVWVGSLLLAAGPLRIVAASAGSPAGRLVFPLGLVSAALMVTPWPFLALAYYVFAGTCLAAAIGRARVDGPAWLLVAIGGIGLYVFNTEDDRAWLWIPFGLAWMVVGLLHLARVSAVDPPTQSPELTVSVP